MKKKRAQERHYIGDLVIDTRRIALRIESRKGGTTFVMRVFSTSGSSWLSVVGERWGAGFPV